MSGGIKIGKIIRDVQADFFNTLYAKPGYGESDLVHFLTTEINNFSEEEQTKLKELIALQNTKAVSLVDSLKSIGQYAAELAKIDEEIKGIVDGKGLSLEVTDKEVVVEEPVMEMANIDEAVVTEAKAADVSEEVKTDTAVNEGEADKALEITETSEVAQAEPVEEKKEEVAAPEIVAEEKKDEVTVTEEAPAVDVPVFTAVAEEAKAESPAVPSTPESTPTVDETPVVEATAGTTENAVASESTATSVAVETPAAPAVTEAPVATEVPTVVETPTVAETPVAPINETVTVTTSSGGLEDDAVPVAEEKPFSLSPINEGVTPAVAETPVAAQAAPAATPTAEQPVPQAAPVAEIPAAPAEEAVKFAKSDATPAKAILVTAVQFGKLTSSRETQKALMSAKMVSGANNGVANVQVDEQTLIANGLLAPTEDATKKQMEGIIEQANALYKEGKTAEAQALYNQVSSMNQSMQAANTAQPEAAKVLVNTPAPAQAIAA